MSLGRIEPVVYLGGKFVPASEAHIAIYDAAVVLGATVTDMARTFRHQPFRFERHLARFYRSCRYARIAPPVTSDESLRLSHELVARNAALVGAEQDLAVVWFISPGELRAYAGGAGAAGEMKPTYCIHTFPLCFPLWAGFFTEGARVVTPSIRHVPPECVDPKIKCRSRMQWWLADQETHLVDPQAVSLCLDLQGNVTETSGANFLIVQEGTVVQPGPRNILPGVSQQTVRELCQRLGIGYEMRDFQVYDVINADEALLASTPYCLAPVTRINGLSIGDGAAGGAVFRRIIAAWSAMVGLDIVKQITAAAH
jgi:branched-subunit amino acid aminotransferase/4-amino-4-deoxychorismate lyase